MREDYFTNSIDEVSYLMVRGASLKAQARSSPSSHWFVYQLGSVKEVWLQDFANRDDTEVSVAEFLHQRNELKFQLSKERELK